MEYISKYKIGDKVNMYIGEKVDTKITGIIEAIKFTEMKIYYDVNINAADGIPTILHDIDAALLENYE